MDLPTDQIWKLWDMEMEDAEEERLNAFHAEPVKRA